LEHVRPLFNVFLEAFDIAKVPSGENTDVRPQLTFSETNEHAELVQAELRAIAAFKEFVVKLNDAAFRPLFRRLYDWAFVDDSGRPQSLFVQ
jgi:U3 small nucleolar RNA-associated protein 10